MAGSTIFDNKYIIYKNTSGLKGNVNNNLTDSFKASGVPLSATLTGSFRISHLFKTMSWTGELILTPKDSWCTYLKCKSGDGSAQYFYAQNGKFKLGSSGQIGVAEFGFGILCTDLYQWDNHKSIFVNEFPVELVDKIDVNKLDQKEDFSKNYNDIYGNVVEKDYLNMIGNIQTIPRYYITNNRSYKIPVFKTNIELYSNNLSHSGQYIFDNEISFKDASSMDVKYWGYSPQVYPIVIFNKTADFDTTIGWKDAGRAWYTTGLNSHSFSKKGSTLQIDGMSYTIGENDCIVAYTRDCGVWSTSGTTAPLWRVMGGGIEGLQDGIISANGGAATLTFSEMKMYLLNNNNYDFTFNLTESYKNKFTSTPTTNNCFSQIIRTMPDITSTATLSIKDIADVVSNSYVEQSFGYIYQKDEGNIWSDDIHWYVSEFLNLTTGTWTFKNFQYISTNSIDNIDTSASSYWESRSSSVGQDITNNNGIFKSNWDMYCHIDGGINQIGTGAEKPGVIEVNEVLKANHNGKGIGGLHPHLWGEATRNLRTWEGTFPAFCPFFKDMANEVNHAPDYGNYPTNFYGSSNGYYYSAQVETIGVASSMLRDTVWLKLGYQKTIDDEKTTANTFGLAIVIWRNGKLYL